MMTDCVDSAVCPEARAAEPDTRASDDVLFDVRFIALAGYLRDQLPKQYIAEVAVSEPGSDFRALFLLKIPRKKRSLSKVVCSDARCVQRRGIGLGIPAVCDKS